MGLLTVTRREHESICLTVSPDADLESLRDALTSGIVIRISNIKLGKCRVQIDAPDEIEILRSELCV